MIRLISTTNRVLLFMPLFYRKVITHPYPVIASFSMAIVFTERLVVDQVVYQCVESLKESIKSTATVFCVLVGWLFILVALIIDRRGIKRALDRIRAFHRRVLSELWSLFSLVLMSSSLLFVLLARGAIHGESITTTTANWLKAVWKLASDLISMPVITLIGAVTLVYLICYLINKYLRKKVKTVEEAVHETIVSSFFVLANAVVYVWLYILLVFPKISRVAMPEVLGGLVKDTIIYSLVALVIVVGTYKAEETLRKLKEAVHRWAVLAIMGGGTIVCAIPALWLDLNYKDQVQAGGSPAYPFPWQWELISIHIMLRDFGLLVPLIVFSYLRFLTEIERINLELESLRS